MLLTRHKPTISHWADVVEREPVGQFGHRLVSNLVWLETVKIKVENKMVFIIVKMFQRRVRID